MKNLHQIIVMIFCSFICFTITIYTQEDLAKKTQNPLSNLISLPFQNNTNFGIGPDD